MIRRVYVSDLHPGDVALHSVEAHHIRDVLRLEAGAQVELFNDAGQTATGILKYVNPANVVVQVQAIEAAVTSNSVSLTVASAVPKGDRADWMVEKLSELGVFRFIPLITERSVVVPAGRNKMERWERSSIESAKQSRRSGIMQISPLITLDAAISSVTAGWYLSIEKEAIPVRRMIDQDFPYALSLFIGPEGGWTDGEMARMRDAGLIPVSLSSTVLRVETAATVAAAVVACLTETHLPPNSD